MKSVRALKPPAPMRTPARKLFPGLSDGELIEYLEDRALHAVQGDLPAIISELENLWSKTRLPCEKPQNVRRFLQGWLSPDADRARVDAWNGPDITRIIKDAIEPLSMALGSPEDVWPKAWLSAADAWKLDRPLTQADFDWRLMLWMRNVIAKRKISALRNLATALEKIPVRLYYGITAAEVFESIRLPESQRKAERRVLEHFWKIVVETNRLPRKGELAASAEVMENATKYWKRLGLRGLPQER